MLKLRDFEHSTERPSKMCFPYLSMSLRIPVAFMGMACRCTESIHFCRNVFGCEHRVFSSSGWDLACSVVLSGAQVIWLVLFWGRWLPSVETDVEICRLETCVLCFCSHVWHHEKCSTNFKTVRFETLWNLWHIWDSSKDVLPCLGTLGTCRIQQMQVWEMVFARCKALLDGDTETAGSQEDRSFSPWPWINTSYSPILVPWWYHFLGNELGMNGDDGGIYQLFKMILDGSAGAKGSHPHMPGVHVWHCLLLVQI